MIAVRTRPDVFSWARQGGEPTTVQRDALATIAPLLVGIGGLIVLIAFAVRTVVARRIPIVALPLVFRALRTDAGIVVLGACAFMLLHLVQTTTADGTLLPKDLVVAVRILAVGLAVGGALFGIGTLRGFTKEDLHRAPQLAASFGIAGAGGLGLAVSATDNLAAAVTTAAIVALAGAFTGLVLSIRNLARHEHEHPTGAL